MKKTVTPKQLELTAGKTTEELLIATLPPHIDPESPAFKEDIETIKKAEMAEAATAVLAARGPVMGSGFAFGYRASDDDFDWDSPDEEAVILREQRATAAYRNRGGELIIRQRAAWDEDQDKFVFISPENEVAFFEGLAKRARE